MGVFSYVKRKKEELLKKQHVDTASELKALKEERIKLEGRKKVRDIEQKEKAKIKALKKEEFSNSKFARAVKSIKSSDTLREYKSYLNKKKKERGGQLPMFGK